MNPARKLIIFTAKLYRFVQVSFQELQEVISWPSYQKVEHLQALFLLGLLVVTCAVFSIDIIADKIMRTIYALFI